MTKPFDKILFAEHDAIGKQRVARYLFMQGFEVKEGTQYGIDLHVWHNDKPLCGVEVEQRDFGGRCTYETIHVAERKRKFFETAPQNVLFALDMGGKWAYYISGYQILKSPMVKMDTKLTKGESFFDVPIENWREIVLEQ